MKFTYEIYDIGWANAQLEVNNKIEYFSVSYLTDALKDLLEGIASLIPGCIQDDELKNSVNFEWYSEPSGSVWNIESMSNEQIRIKIESYEDLDLKIGKQVSLNETCDKDEFIRCVLDEMDNILSTYGLVGYRETWYEHDFPVTAYLKLKNYLADGKSFHIEHIERHPGSEYTKSNLQEELLVMGLKEVNVG